MKYIIVLIVGMALLVLGAQSAIRLMVNHADAGVLGWLPGGFAVWLACYLAAVVVGVLFAGWAGKRAQQSRHES
ncbi:hypothetical protein GCM10028798_26420 [Humibacter antri]